MGKSFQKIHASSVGSFGETTDKIPQWIKANGGSYSKDINDDVTHLIATASAIKYNVEAIRKAKRLKHVKIVKYDWLEDSLQSKTRRPKREGPYLWEEILNEQKKKTATNAKVQKQKKAPKKNGKRGTKTEKSLEEFEKGARAIISEMESLGYHVYKDDDTGTAYCATLVRSLEVKNRKEKYLIKLYESNTKPYTYATWVKYSRVGASGKDLLAPRGSTLDLAISMFKKFFKVKTGMSWEDRYDDAKIPEPKKDTREELYPVNEGWYQYERPSSLMARLCMAAEIARTKEIQTQLVSPTDGTAKTAAEQSNTERAAMTEENPNNRQQVQDDENRSDCESSVGTMDGRSPSNTHEDRGSSQVDYDEERLMKPIKPDFE